MRTDVVVVGSGIAGLFFATKVAGMRPDLHIFIMAKDSAEATNTRYAQGGIAAVMNQVTDSFDKHIEDTLSAGGGLCDETVVRMVVTQAPHRLQELIALGVQFDHDRHGNWDLGLEGGHSQNRILHCRDVTGLEIERALLHAVAGMPNVTLLENHFVSSLLTSKNRCCGVAYTDAAGNYQQLYARAVILCTGGCGQLFSHTTNPAVATGDGVALAHRAGARMADMEYIQFHPTALFESGNRQYFLLSEALRGYGAHVVDAAGRRFLFKYDARGELATRDIVAGAIGSEMAATAAECMYLDCRHLDQNTFQHHFPAIYDYCTRKGFDTAVHLLPIVPVAHYQCGGVAVNTYGETSVAGLYALGECARTGLHGSNRLASNSLLEAVVYAHQASVSVAQAIDTIPEPDNNPEIARICKQGPSLNRLQQLKRRLHEMMDCLFLNREKFDATEFEELKHQIEQQCQDAPPLRMYYELYNMATTSCLIVSAVLAKQDLSGRQVSL